MPKNSGLFPGGFHSGDDSSKPALSTSSELADNRPPIQKGKQTSQESVSTSKRLRSNQAPVKNVGCHGGSPAQGYQK